MTKSINCHEGKKYLRTITSCVDGKSIQVDVYDVIDAFHTGLDLPSPVAHAVKKLLCPGQRGKGDRLADLIGAEAAIARAIELERQRQPVPFSTEPPPLSEETIAMDRAQKAVRGGK